MALRIYLCPVVEEPPGSTLWQCMVHEHLMPQSPTRTYRFSDDVRRKVCVVLVTAPAADHAAILADPRGATPLCPGAADLAAFRAQLDAPLSSFPAAQVQAAKTRAELMGVPTSWATGATTLRQMFRYVLRRFRATTQGHDLPEFQALTARPLATLAAAFPAAERAALVLWLHRRGLPAAHADGATLGAVLHSICASLVATAADFAGESI